MEAITKMCNEYKVRGCSALPWGGNAFECIRSKLEINPFQICFTTCNANNHVPKIEQGIRKLKEWIRCARMIMKFKQIPRKFTIKMVEQTTKLVNSIPKKGRLHPVLSLRQSIMGVPLRLPLTTMGQYVQGHIGSTNNMGMEWSLCALYTGAVDNNSGYSVFKFNTRKQYLWKESQRY